MSVDEEFILYSRLDKETGAKLEAILVHETKKQNRALKRKQLLVQLINECYSKRELTPDSSPQSS